MAACAIEGAVLGARRCANVGISQQARAAKAIGLALPGQIPCTESALGTQLGVVALLRLAVGRPQSRLIIYRPTPEGHKCIVRSVAQRVLRYSLHRIARDCCSVVLSR